MAGALWVSWEVFHEWPGKINLVAILEAKEGTRRVTRVPYSVTQVGHLEEDMVGHIGVNQGAT